MYVHVYESHGVYKGCPELSNKCLSSSQLLGEVGRVYSVYSGGDVMVMVKGKSWVFNPLCLSPASDSTEGDKEDDPS